MELLGTSFFWVTLGQIMMINIMLSGDNAVVIAMASRALPPKQQKQAILFGSFGAIILRVIGSITHSSGTSADTRVELGAISVLSQAAQ